MLSTFIWYRLVESNHYSHFRRMLSYPLNESGKILAGEMRFELMMTISKTVALGH